MKDKQQQGVIIESLLPALDNLDNNEISVFYFIELKVLICCIRL